LAGHGKGLADRHRTGSLLRGRVPSSRRYHVLTAAIGTSDLFCPGRRRVRASPRPRRECARNNNTVLRVTPADRPTDEVVEVGGRAALRTVPAADRTHVRVPRRVPFLFRSYRRLEVETLRNRADETTIGFVKSTRKRLDNSARPRQWVSFWFVAHERAHGAYITGDVFFTYLRAANTPSVEP